MNKPEKPTIQAKPRENETAQKSERVTAEKQANAGALETLTDINNRSANLLHVYSKKISSDDGYQVIDPKTVTATFQEFIPKAVMNPAPIIKEQMSLCADLAMLWQRTSMRALFNMPAEPVIVPSKQDKRFKNEAWTENWYFDFVKQHYLLLSRCIESSVSGVKDVDRHTHHKAQFYTRQFVNALSPTNFAPTNPSVLNATIETCGTNLLNGLRNFIEDLERGAGHLSLKMSDLSAFKFGENIASSPGKVVFQNELMQLIQYAPSTPMVQRRPLLIVPPWINKFYILDLKPKNSFIKWCVDQGHTVFVISWINPGAELGGKGFSDYLLEGPLAALDAIERATGESEANVVGYCIGGTLTASALAYMTATNDQRV